MTTTTVRDKGQITLPKFVRDAAKLEQGTKLAVEVTDDGTICLRPFVQVNIDPQQAWFWSEPWQAMLSASFADLKAGRTTVFEDEDSFLDSL